MLPGAALLSLAARFCWQGQHFRLWTVPERVSGPPPLMLPGAALSSLAARFCWQGQHFRAPLEVAARRSTLEPRGSFLLAGAALQALDGARARFGAPPLDAARRSTFEPRGSFLLAGAALQALRGARARFGAPPSTALSSLFRASRLVSAGRGSTSGSGRCPSAFRGPPPRCCQARLSLAARFCWQGQRFRLWTVPERVSGPPPSGAALSSLFRASRLVSAGRGSTSPPRCCQAQHFGASRLTRTHIPTLTTHTYHTHTHTYVDLLAHTHTYLR